VLPDADDFPSLPAELAGDALIAGHVVCSFFIPKCAVGFWAGVALGAAVPKTSVDKDGDLLLGEGKVGLSGQRKMPSPAFDSMASKKGQKRLLCQFIAARSHARHKE
jgi:hypothetical protein